MGLYTKFNLAGEELPDDAVEYAFVRHNEIYPDGQCRMWFRGCLGELSHADAMVAAAKPDGAGVFDDWRAPTAKERFLLNDLERFDPALDPIFESASWEWTASPGPSDPQACAFLVVSHDGDVGIALRRRGSQGWVRPVRVCAPPAGQ